MSTYDEIHAKLATLSPLSLEIKDDSAEHAGHAGAQGGGGHYWLTIVSDVFQGKSRLERHRLIYAALGDMMQKKIHALSIQAYSPEEF